MYPKTTLFTSISIILQYIYNYILMEYSEVQLFSDKIMRIYIYIYSPLLEV